MPNCAGPDGSTCGFWFLCCFALAVFRLFHSLALSDSLNECMSLSPDLTRSFADSFSCGGLLPLRVSLTLNRCELSLYYFSMLSISPSCPVSWQQLLPKQQLDWSQPKRAGVEPHNARTWVWDMDGVNEVLDFDFQKEVDWWVSRQKETIHQVLGFSRTFSSWFH